MSKQTAPDIYERQQNYCKTTATDDLIDSHLFIESMRKLGYKDVVRAADEVVDNSIEANASNVYVLFGFDEPGSTKVSSIAFVDDGHGMIPDMVSAACRWGGTDRHGSRVLFGRFGFGLPSASVSQGRKFEVYSRIDSGPFHGVSIDLDEIVDGVHTKEGRVATPAAKPTELPAWVAQELEASGFPGGLAAARTVVIWSKLDYKKYRTMSDLQRAMLERFGLTYRGFLRNTVLNVNGTKVQPVDPLFTTPGARHFEPLPEGAEALPGVVIPIKDEESGEALGDIVVRYSFMHPAFLKDDRGRKGQDPAKARFGIRKENNGLIMLRAGRQVDVVQDRDVYNFQNNTRYVGVEISFPPALDELFGVTTSKQQVTFSDRVVTLLKQHGVPTAIRQIENRYQREGDELKGSKLAGTGEEPRLSEQVMSEIGPILRRKTVSHETAEQAEENRKRAIDRTVEKTHVDRDDVEKAVDRDIANRPYKVETERMPEGPFYRIELRGSQIVIFLNTAHRFYRDIYISVTGVEGEHIRASLELLLFVMGESEIESNSEHQIWYAGERIDWSRKLEAVLGKLDSVLESIGGKPSAAAGDGEGQDDDVATI